jgi:hypothetical protein
MKAVKVIFRGSGWVLPKRYVAYWKNNIIKLSNIHRRKKDIFLKKKSKLYKRVEIIIIGDITPTTRH